MTFIFVLIIWCILKMVVLFHTKQNWIKETSNIEHVNYNTEGVIILQREQSFLQKLWAQEEKHAGLPVLWSALAEDNHYISSPNTHLQLLTTQPCIETVQPSK